MFGKYILQPFIESSEKFARNNAFCINEKFYTFFDFIKAISKLRKAIQDSKVESSIVGLVINDNIETYASIFALWFEGYAYLPLNPDQPYERNVEIIRQAKIKLVIDSCVKQKFTNLKLIETSLLKEVDIDLSVKQISDKAIAYLLFTSGSTGKPKGVPITRRNLKSFVEAFWSNGYLINEHDRFLQPFDLTFDLSVMSYLIPLTKGACVYTVPHNQIRFSYVARLLDEHSLTVALMVPSTIRYLKPYFNEIELPSLKYNLFCGEALPDDLLKEWLKCVPNATIDNVYGPTENTIFCSCYRYSREELNKSHNGVISIGKAMKNCQMSIVNEENLEVSYNQQGELCLSGSQLTPGYWNSPDKNSEMFFTDNQGKRFYKTGDICFKDSEGDILFVGRKDFQTKIQGYRVELGEIEFHTRSFLEGINTVALTYINDLGNNEIVLFIENDVFDLTLLINYLHSILPSYMVPNKFLFEPIFPLNISGKIDRNKLKKTLFR
jgi:D-alanine--poly(phosphoribitol) ligase subunit 1